MLTRTQGPAPLSGRKHPWVPADGPSVRLNSGERCSLPPNPAGTFQRTGLSSDYAAFATGLAWMYSWQGRQTIRVLRRILAMWAAHAGWPGPGLPSRASAVTW